MTDKNLENEKTEEQWRSFKDKYWMIFGLVIVTQFIAFNIKDYSQNIYVALGLFDLLLKIVMIFVVGIFSYRITRKKRYFAVGVLGGVWVGIVLNLISYWVVKLIYHKKQAGLI